MLNGRVRNGNGCGHPGLVTGKSQAGGAPGPLRGRRVTPGGCIRGSGKGCSFSAPEGPWGPREQVNAVKRLAVSTGRLNTLLCVHLRPIDLVVFQEPSPTRGGRPHLGGGFTLRCLQRLSVPYVATLRCGWRHNRNTRGTSLPILSY
jgi:hypothetical protein